MNTGNFLTFIKTVKSMQTTSKQRKPLAGAWTGCLGWGLAFSVGPTRLWDTLALPPRNDDSHSTNSKEFYYFIARGISITLQSKQHHILAPPEKRCQVPYRTDHDLNPKTSSSIPEYLGANDINTIQYNSLE